MADPKVFDVGPGLATQNPNAWSWDELRIWGASWSFWCLIKYIKWGGHKMTAAFLLTVLVCFSCFPSSPRSTSVFACVWTSFFNVVHPSSAVQNLPENKKLNIIGRLNMGDVPPFKCGNGSKMGTPKEWHSIVVYIIAKSAKKIGFLHYFDLWANRSSICSGFPWFSTIVYHVSLSKNQEICPAHSQRLFSWGLAVLARRDAWSLWRPVRDVGLRCPEQSGLTKHECDISSFKTHQSPTKNMFKPTKKTLVTAIKS